MTRIPWARAPSRIASIVANPTAPAPLRRTGQRFKSWFSTFKSFFRSLSSRSAQAAQMPKHARKSEPPKQIEINQNDGVQEFIDSVVDHVQQKLHPGLRNSLTQFTFGISEAILEADLTLDNLRKFLEEAQDMKFEGRKRIVIEVMRNTPAEKIAELFADRVVV
jgi:hypothetical protein